ncbi:GNAT family N-acetyltransferase [Candidatus Soleaferrea massiliensis]|uniref:GNAT family N-acetyltransferase n=1 Tax=Candidatus Soleaferrea massiliensis TaxID=1470354 RepID=UPI00058C3190|nr:GNAT family N-acetyltransferase [Candidatus Soleaferrea massiliensis]
MDELQIIKADTDAQLKTVSELAEKIWHQHFTPIIGTDQVNYMVDKFQSCRAISGQVKDNGYEYYLFHYNGADVGYLGVKAENGALFLSKIYLEQSFRGRKIASRAIRFLMDRCEREGLSKIWLTVNRENLNTIAAYETMGFVKVREQKADIGNGFYMDDYIMEKTI